MQNPSTVKAIMKSTLKAIDKLKKLVEKHQSKFTSSEREDVIQNLRDVENTINASMGRGSPPSPPYEK